MDEKNQCCVIGTNECNRSLKLSIGRLWKKFCRWIFLYIWCRYCYRHVMRFLHHFNLHYAPPTTLSSEYGNRKHWCRWCGLRGDVWKYDPNKSLL